MGRALLPLCLALFSTGCGGTTESEQFDFRVYDPVGRISTEVTSANIARSSARAVPQGEGSAIVSVSFTPAGVSKFCRLTRELAQRGAATGERQQLVVEVNEDVWAKP